MKIHEKYYLLIPYGKHFDVNAGVVKKLKIASMLKFYEANKEEFSVIIGPFDTKMGADYMNAHPYCPTVTDAEELAAIEDEARG